MNIVSVVVIEYYLCLSTSIAQFAKRRVVVVTVGRNVAVHIGKKFHEKVRPQPGIFGAFHFGGDVVEHDSLAHTGFLTAAIRVAAARKAAILPLVRHDGFAQVLRNKARNGVFPFKRLYLFTANLLRFIGQQRQGDVSFRRHNRPCGRHEPAVYGKARPLFLPVFIAHSEHGRPVARIVGVGGEGKASFAISHGGALQRRALHGIHLYIKLHIGVWLLLVVVAQHAAVECEAFLNGLLGAKLPAATHLLKVRGTPTLHHKQEVKRGAAHRIAGLLEIIARSMHITFHFGSEQQILRERGRRALRQFAFGIAHRQ